MKTYRSAFTLIEMIVVIAMITILGWLMVVAVTRARSKGNELQVISDISQLSAATKTFYTNYGFYPPSRLALCEKYTDYFQPPSFTIPKDQLHADSIACLIRMWPRIVGTKPNGNTRNWSVFWLNGAGAYPRNYIDWNANNLCDGEVVLEGDECIVFFLGGIEKLNATSPGCVGFSLNPTDPSDLNSTQRQCFYQFKHLKSIHPNGYLSCLDPYGMPYAYFSNYNKYGFSDCPSLGVQPYKQSTGFYYNPDSCQIICAGADRLFGGGFLLPAPVPGSDDYSNFSVQPLGVQP